MSKPLLIGIHGKPHAGKDIIADHLVKYYNFYKYGPSVRVKMTASAMFDVPLNYFIDEDKKETVDPFWKMSYREMAQKVGKESSRDVFGDDIWMRHVEKFLINPLQYIDGVVLADIRYISEAEWVAQHGGYVIIVKRDDGKRGYIANSTHPAEQGIPDKYGDYVIHNQGTLEELFGKVDELMDIIFFRQNLIEKLSTEELTKKAQQIAIFAAAEQKCLEKMDEDEKPNS
ncbi:MAG TPA: hypothetical protein VJ201_03480 [Candidatus Babeliales bacterium]|nr:hypothetical protein [Candidatus Babeliales bacterium]